MMRRDQEAGLTLVVSLIMLIVLTLLVVSAVRFGNLNLRIAGNAQTEVEASAATQVALENVVAQVIAAEKIDEVPAQPSMSVTTGGKTYAVSVKKPACVLTKNVPTTTLKHDDPKDVPCYQGVDSEVQLGPDGLPIGKPSACKDQQWDIEASIPVAGSEVQVTMLQGVAVRVGAAVQCP